MRSHFSTSPRRHETSSDSWESNSIRDDSSPFLKCRNYKRHRSGIANSRSQSEPYVETLPRAQLDDDWKVIDPGLSIADRRDRGEREFIHHFVQSRGLQHLMLLYSVHETGR